MQGRDIRRYRREIGWNQGAFARELGLSQSALSLLESGKIAVSDEHNGRLTKAFETGKVKPRISEFLQDLERHRAEGQAALTAPPGRHLVLTVWRWGPDFDLSRPPEPEDAVGVVAVRATNHDAIAVQMGKGSEAWSENEILVFERCEPEKVRDNDLCLVQVKAPRGKGTKTLIAVAHLAPVARGQTLQLEPVSPPGPIFSASDELIACLRAVYRARYCG